MMAVGSHLRRFLTNSGLMFMERGLRVGVAVLMMALMARQLGLEQFGLYSYLIAFSGFFLPLVSLGLEVVGVRRLVEAPAQRGHIIGSMLMLKLLGGLMAGAGCVVAIAGMEGWSSARPWLMLPVGIATVFQAGDTFELFFQSIADQRWTTLVRIGGLVIGLILRAALLWMQAPLEAFLWVLMAEYAIVAGGFWTVYRWCRGPRMTWSWQEAGGLILQSWPIALSSAAIMIYMRIDQVMMEHMIGSREVGIYAVAVKISESWYMLPVAMGTAALPLLVESRQRSREEFQAAAQHLFDAVSALAVLAGLGITLVGPVLVEWLFGKEYRDAGTILTISGWTGIFVCWGVIRGAALNACGIARFQLVATIVGALVNIALNLWTIPRWGGAGAACATLVAQGFATHLTGWFYAPTRPYAGMQLRSVSPLRAWRGLVALSGVFGLIRKTSIGGDAMSNLQISPRCLAIRHVIRDALLRMGLLGPWWLFLRSPVVLSGWLTSLRRGASINARGEPVPWITYPCQEVLERQLPKDLSVFEWGCGNSTRWWARRSIRVTSVEHDEAWKARIAPQLPPFCTILHQAADSPAYATAIAGAGGGPFDIVVIDGVQRNACAEACLEYLSPRGVIIWDNTDRDEYAPGTARLRQAGFLRVDFWGMCPGVLDLSCTSIFFRPGNCVGI